MSSAPARAFTALINALQAGVKRLFVGMENNQLWKGSFLFEVGKTYISIRTTKN
jgi:hypothetical protein